MSHRSRGCLRCRQRRVKCDQGRPSCQRCVTRSEACVGYRDELDLCFQDQTQTTVQKIALVSDKFNDKAYQVPSRNHRARSRSLDTCRIKASPVRHHAPDPPRLHSGGDVGNLKDEAVSNFLDNYVLYPCHESSSPGFLEHLPGLFKEVNVNGRLALRWAVEAASLADYSCRKNDENSARKALQQYSQSLNALSKSLSKNGKEPDDYDLMTVVTLFIHDENSFGAHSQGMAHILRLRGHKQFHDPRGWGLFRLAHHRLQKERLAKQLSPLPDSGKWLDSLSSDISFVELEKGAFDVTAVCERARSLLSGLKSGAPSWEEMIQLVREMISVDLKISRWRERPEWTFKSLPRSALTGDPGCISRLPARVEVHRDIWMAYEWNYHRTGRIILHQTLLECLLQPSIDLPSAISAHEISNYIDASTSIIHDLADSILSTVPQSLGDIDSTGQCVSLTSDKPGWQAIGAYLLLWPIKIIKSHNSMATETQRHNAELCFERIRERTGMKANLGPLSSI
ncbi:unnamed protein product [Clonostachys rosea]|uniref:Zn(2)-C6 fungal-type domain-containing protein n=1 Tax=Bionectria ochroleuca TaxID=29856 RepID=A0ABY6UI69_BIOOC|nr:unnamed protein product [Clonostachys rosea]